MHSHNHNHNHSHAHTELPQNLSHRVEKMLIIGISLNIIFVIIEVVFGWVSSSLGLLSDAGHNLSDVFSLILSFVAIRISRKAASTKYTYGYKRGTVLASFINAMFLLVAVGIILTEAIGSLFNPKEVSGLTMIWVASVGVIINSITAVLLIREQAHDLNIKGAFLHMLADTLVSLGVVASGILIYYTNWYITDSIISIIVAIIIAVSSWNIFKSSLRLSLDGVPENIDVLEVEKTIKSIQGIKDFHHLHIWALSTTETAMTVHIVIYNSVQDTDSKVLPGDYFEKKQVAIRQELGNKLEKIGIHHVTVEIECDSANCMFAHCSSVDNNLCR